MTDTQRRKAMCANKATFFHREKAEVSAAKWGQRVYECPVCFCWHCTNKPDWKDEFIPIEAFQGLVRAAEIKLRQEFNKQKKELNLKINALEKENADLRRKLKGKP